jgi:predicted transcriptional regulator
VPKRKYDELRSIILENLSKGQKTVNQVATETGINWRTVDNHIIYLAGKGYLREVFVSRYVKIYEITDRGFHAFEEGDI